MLIDDFVIGCLMILGLMSLLAWLEVASVRSVAKQLGLASLAGVVAYFAMG